MVSLVRPLTAAFTGIRAETIDGWTRPLDWLAMPDVTSAMDVFHGLLAVYEHGRNAVALQATVSGAATYTVDWGDGTVETVTSGTAAEHSYTYASLPASSLSSRGYKQALVTVRPSSGGVITVFDVQRRAAGERAVAYTVPWLDIVASLPSVTTFSSAFGSSGTVSLRLLERADFRHTTGVCTSFANAFRTCSGLRVFRYSGSLAAVTTFTFAFSECSSIQSVSLSGITSACTTLASLFSSCSGLVSATLGGSLAGVTTISSLAASAFSLRRFVFPSTAWTALTTVSPFTACRSLQVIAGSPPPITFSIADCNMDAAQINAMFALLPTVTGQTITVTGNPGAASCTQSIATAKGWTVAT